MKIILLLSFIATSLILGPAPAFSSSAQTTTVEEVLKANLRERMGRCNGPDEPLTKILEIKMDSQAPDKIIYVVDLPRGDLTFSPTAASNKFWSIYYDADGGILHYFDPSPRGYSADFNFNPQTLNLWGVSYGSHSAGYSLCSLE